MLLEEIKALCCKSVYSTEEKTFLASSANEFGIPLPTCSCADRWNDLAVQVYHAMAGNGIKYIYKKKITTVTKEGSFSQSTPLEKIENLKKRDSDLFSELYKENLT